MLQRFIEWMDSWGDHINPLVVREVRRMFRNPAMICLPSLYCVFVIILCIVSWFDNLNCSSMFFTFAVIVCYLGLFCGSASTRNIEGASDVDEMFRMNTLSLRQYLHADITMSVLTSLFYISLALLPLSVVQIIGPVRIIVPVMFIDFRWSTVPFSYIIPLLTFLIRQTMSLYSSSFGVHIPRHLKLLPFRKKQTIPEQIKVVLLVIGSLFIGGLLMASLWVAMFLWIKIFQLQPFSIYNNFDLFSLCFLLPVMLIVMSLVAYSLCIKGLRINHKIRFSGIFYNLIIYSILHICFIAIYFTLTFFFR
ncbi:MAG: hypothetical protein LBJ00_14230 [Planctomycetaceae bacterium]|jgi:hypothetical protein|nr:hypothetical protein [Planctomycetaceae bacterium]